VDADKDPIRIKCRLTNLSDNQHTRTDVVEGDCPREPAIHQCFVMFAEPIDKTCDFRLVETTYIRSCDYKDYTRNGSIVFETLNTRYLWEPM
jgi:hypothetical protein